MMEILKRWGPWMNCAALWESYMPICPNPFAPFPTVPPQPLCRPLLAYQHHNHPSRKKNVWWFHVLWMSFKGVDDISFPIVEMFVFKRSLVTMPYNMKRRERMKKLPLPNKLWLSFKSPNNPKAELLYQVAPPRPRRRLPPCCGTVDGFLFKMTVDGK